MVVVWWGGGEIHGRGVQKRGCLEYSGLGPQNPKSGTENMKCQPQYYTSGLSVKVSIVNLMFNLYIVN